MAQFIMQPQFRNPWVQNLPNMLQNMALQGIAQKFRGKQLAGDRKIRAAERKEDRQLASYALKSAQDFKTSEREAAQEFTTSERESKDPEFVAVKGREFYWTHDKKTGKLTKTKTPVPITKGTQFTVDKDGKVTFTQGNVGLLTKANQTAVQKELMSNVDQIDAIDKIIDAFEPRFHETKTRIGMDWTAFKEKTGLGKQPTPAQLGDLKKYTTYMKRAHSELIQKIHAFAGSNMTKHELARVLEAVGDPGTGYFDQDSATQYITAAKDARLTLTRIAGRNHYYLNKLGYTQKQLDSYLESGQIMSETAFMEMVDEKALGYKNRLIAESQARGQPPDQASIKRQMKAFLTTEFGLRFRK